MIKTINKYILASSIIAILTVTLFGGYSISRYQANEVREENERLEACILTFRELLNHKGSDFRVVDGKLLAGTYQVNGNFELPDRVQQIFGGVATIFMGDERVSTNVLDAEGKRAVGTRLEGAARDAVFKLGKPYRGMAPILGVSYLTAYDPIRNRAGEVIGVLFVGVKESDFLARLSALRINLAIAICAAVTVITLFMVMLERVMRRVENKSDNQRRFQQTLIDTIPNPIFYKDADCRYLGCNRAFEAYVGLSQDDMIGRTPHELWPEELADRYLRQDLELLKNPGMQVYEASVRYADGTLREVIFNKATFNESDGSVRGLVGVILDITERKAAEDATKSAYQQLFDIVEFLPDATLVVDKDKRVIAWNRAIEQMTGIGKDEIMGRGDYEYALPFYGDSRPLLIDLIDQDEERIRRDYAHVKREGHTLFAEVFLPSFRGGDGCCLWATATPLFDRGGNRVGAIESIRDITEYKRAEGERSRLESQLHHARMMETFMVRLGHDLRTPLTPLTTLLPLIRKRVADHELGKLVDICCRSTASMRLLADKAHLLGTLSSTIRSGELVRIPLVSVVEQSLAVCAAILADKEIACQTEVPTSLLVQVIPGQMRELFVNLISNAVRFSAERGTVRISAAEEGGRVTVAVHDDGIGLAPGHLERIFDAFFKTDESRHDLDGSGLGLTICKRIVQNHHGRIWAESPGIGGGSTIRFTINEQNTDYSI